MIVDHGKKEEGENLMDEKFKNFSFLMF